jgi:hypothetical protein
MAVLVPKQDLLRPLKALVAFDPKGSPYVGVQLGDPPKFYRSGTHGYIMSRDFVDGESVAHVSLSNLIDCLKNLPEDAVQLGLDANGIMRIHGTSSDIFESESRVHTVAVGQAGLKKHDIGETRFEVDKAAFSRIDIRGFKSVTPPVLVKGRLMLVTDAGATVLWDGPESIQKLPDIYPRETFLRMVSGGAEVRRMAITSNGYWGAEIDELVTYAKGHVLGRQIFDNYAAAGTEVARLPAQRLMVGLDAAVGLLEPTERVDVDPRLGVLAKGKFGDNRNSLGEAGDWPRFGMLAKTAQVVSRALCQTLEDEAVLSLLPPTSTGSSVMRLQRGPFQVNFRSY